MSEDMRAIVVNTGGVGEMDIGAFFRNQALVMGAMESMKHSAGTLRRSIGQVARSFGGAAKAAEGVLSAMMQTSTLASGLEKGMMNLYRYAKAYGKRLSDCLDGLATTALYLRNSLAAMAGPLLQSVAPAVDYVADRFVDLFNIINQVFARLTGSRTYIAARRFGDAWDSEIGRVRGAVSAVQRYVMGFDEINILGGGSGGGSGGGGGSAAMFEEREIDDGIASFADRLKEAVESADWQGLGTMLGGLINDGLDAVDWHGLGEKVGGYINGAILTAYYLLDTVNFTNIGARIAEFMNAALAEIDFSHAGEAVALFFAAAIQAFAGFAEEFDWGQFAASAAEAVNGFANGLARKLDDIDWAALTLRLVDGLNGFVLGVDWPGLGEGLGRRINDLLAILKTATMGFDWSGAGKALASGVNALLNSVDWAALGDWLNGAIKGVLEFGIAFFNDLDVNAFCAGIKSALERVDWQGVAQKLWQLFSAALVKLGQAAGTLLFGGRTDVSVGVSLLRNGWTSIGQFVGTLVTVVANLTRSGSNWTGGLAKWLKDSAGTNAVDLAARLVLRDESATWWSSIKKWFDKAGKQSGNALVLSAKMKNGAATWWDNIRKWFNKQAGKWWNKLELTVEVKNDSKSWWSSVKSWWDGVKQTLGFNISANGGKFAGGGYVTGNGRFGTFASGGAVRGSVASWWNTLPKYASGTRSAHGTMFLAGEAGPEIVGHVGGRTEVLNKSQLAQTMFAAVENGMLAAASRIEFHMPAMASGTVLPYDVSAQIAKTGQDIMTAMDANNEDLIQTIISVAGQIVNALGGLRAAPAVGGVTAQQVINALNQRTQMFGESPLQGV